MAGSEQDECSEMASLAGSKQEKTFINGLRSRDRTGKEITDGLHSRDWTGRKFTDGLHSMTGQAESSQTASIAITGQTGISQMAFIAVTGQTENFLHFTIYILLNRTGTEFSNGSVDHDITGWGCITGCYHRAHGAEASTFASGCSAAYTATSEEAT